MELREAVPPSFSPAYLDANEVHVWVAGLHPSDDMETVASVLSAEEQAQAARFPLPRQAAEFRVARATLRRVLSSYVDLPAGRIPFVYGRFGKPALSHGIGNEIRFNISHCNDLLLCAIARDREVGIDVERIDHRVAAMSVARLFFSAKELMAISRLPRRNQQQAFLACWTRKEAYVKARGIGTRCGFQKFDLPLTPTATVEWEKTEWTLMSLAPAPGYVAAVAVEGRGFSVRWRTFRGASDQAVRRA